jgi:undecaprenyl diphosphate synthase
MTQSTLPGSGAGQGIHVAIIMDGNGRWAQARGQPRADGHRQGTTAVRGVVEAAPDLGVSALTLYTFSSDNWKRPADEVALLMGLLRSFLLSEREALREKGVRLVVIGRRDRLDSALLAEIEATEAATAPGARLLLRLAIDYSSRDLMILALRSAAAAAAQDGPRELERDEFAVHLGRAMHALGPAPDVDLLIRTGGERRLSDFLLWECAYAELLFTPRMWPDFDGRDLAEAVHDFRARERRFGNVPVAV